MSKDDLSFAQVLTDVVSKNYESDTDFASAAGISNSAVSRYKSGQQIPQPATIRKMADPMGMSYARLMAIAYPRADEQEADASGSPSHPLAAQLAILLGENSPMPAAERNNLEQVVGSVLAPYRRYLRGRKAV